MSQDPQQFQRFHNLLSGRLVNSLDPQQINDQTRQLALSQAQFSDCIEVIHDGSDIRKPYAHKLPHLTKVRSLEGEWVNGFNTFNSVLISDVDKRLHLLESTPFSTADDHYGVLAGVSLTAKETHFEQVRRVDEALKAKQSGLPIRHLLDRGHDDEEWFSFLGTELQSKFVIRAKLNRVYPPDPAQKLHQAAFKGRHETALAKFVWRSKVYQDVRLVLSWETVCLGPCPYEVVRSEVFKRDGQRLFKEPMVLITNETVTNQVQALAVYQAYLRRSRIEGIFKFLKHQLGWETFRVRDFLVIQNVLALTYWAGGYFYEQQAELSQEPVVIWLCKLAKSKGKVTLHFLLAGLQIVAQHLLFEEFVRQAGLSKEEVQQLVSYTK
jgi:Transposase DDE domain